MTIDNNSIFGKFIILLFAVFFIIPLYWFKLTAKNSEIFWGRIAMSLIVAFFLILGYLVKEVAIIF